MTPDQKIERAQMLLAWTFPGSTIINYFLLRSPKKCRELMNKAEGRAEMAARAAHCQGVVGAFDDVEESKAEEAKAKTEAIWYKKALLLASKWKNLKNNKEERKIVKAQFANEFKKHKQAINKLREKYGKAIIP
jgi:hypothetical protein